MPNKKDKTPAVRDRSKKPTQLDRIEKKLLRLAGEVGKLSSRIRTLNAWETMEAALKEEPVPRAEEPKWVPQLNEWVCLRRKLGFIGTIETEEGRYRLVHWRKRSDGVDIMRSTEEDSDLRPATEAEIAAHLSLQYQGIEELQEGDACETTQEQEKELLDMANGFMRTSAPSSKGYNIWYFKERTGYVLHVLSLTPTTSDGSLVKRWLPFPIFKKALQGTIKKKQELEASKTKASRKEMIADAMEYMGWDENDSLGELFTPTRRDMLDYLVQFAAQYKQP